MNRESSPPARNIMLTLAYDGTGFSGWQRQAKGQTLQGLVEGAMARLCGHPVTVHGSGRTDAGVHAKAQVANFFTDSPRKAPEIVKGGNAMLPMTVAITSAMEVDPAFHARFSAKGKTYGYDFLSSPVRDPLLANRAWHVGPNLDWAAVRASLPSLLGTKDFKALGSSGGEVKTTVRRISRAEILEAGPGLFRLSLTGSGFLRHMVRTIAGTLWLIGRHKLAPQDLLAIIESLDRAKAGPVAPPHGLCLEEVHYR
ncbi:MAG: tRNA pseudouridine(38-40) synthase TruA [Deltaproteobacteria bacterium]|jgi:tRNA pseudouridine38-40 synthase|nr:tRNA pseudouridine(38-40) synthase TruA [Deltaproteobacteria bacterium]